MAEHLRLYLDARFPSGFAPVPPSQQWDPQAGAIGVNSEVGPAGTIFGYVAAQAGPFHSGRGQFTESSLRRLQEIWPQGGALCHAQHDTFVDDGLERFLGRAINPHRSICAVLDANNRTSVVSCIRCDLAFDAAARVSPHGDLVQYFSERVRNDPDSLSSSLVLQADEESLWGGDLPPVWEPRMVFASDLVNAGDACGSLLGFAGGNLASLRGLARERHSVLAQQETEPDTITAICLPTRTPLRCGADWLQLDCGAFPAGPTAKYAGVEVVLDGQAIATVGTSARLHATHKGLAVEFEPTGYVRQLHDIGRLRFSAEWSGRAGEHVRCSQPGHAANGWRVGLVSDAPEIRRINVTSR